MVFCDRTRTAFKLPSERKRHFVVPVADALPGCLLELHRVLCGWAK